MDDYKSNCIVLRTILGSCLSDINKLMTLWYYGILQKKRIVAYLLLDLAIVELKQILESCRHITINNNIVQFVLNTSGYGGTYSWSIFLLKNSMPKNYFSKMFIARYKKKYQNNMYFFGLGVDRDTQINSSTQFKFKFIQKRKRVEVSRLLIQKVYTMRSILQINTSLTNSNIEEQFNNDISFSTNILLPPNIDSGLAINFINNIISNNNIKKDST